MDLESFRSYCLSKRLVTEELPFGPDVLVFKVAGKMFALTSVDSFSRISLKVQPEAGVELREQHDAVQPAYHMNKKHWVSVEMNGSVSDKLVRQWIDNSYQLVVDGLPRKVRSQLSR